MRVSLGIIPEEERGLCGLFLCRSRKKAGAQMKSMESGGAVVADTGVGDASQPVDCCCGAVPCLEQAGVGYLLL